MIRNKNIYGADDTPDRYLHELGERIAKLSDLVGGKKALAGLLGTHESKLYRYIKGENAISTPGLVSLAQAGGVRVEWLATGEGPMRDLRRQTAEPEAMRYTPIATPQPGLQPLSMLSDDDAAAAPALLAFDAGWLRTTLQAAATDLAVMRVAGEDMVPTLKPDDLVIVDRRDRDARHDGLHVLDLDGAMRIKRLQRLPDGRLRALSDNLAYEPFDVTPDEAGIKLVGRVVWVGARY